MPIKTSGVGRLVPASPLDFSRSAKNLAWLLEVPLHIGQELLATCYGFGSLHELRAAIPAPGEIDKVTGPFDEPRERPPFYPVDSTELRFADNHLAPLSKREMQLVQFSERIMHRREDRAGRLRRRHFAVFDGAFFSSPSVHRKKFAELKRGILAMEGNEQERERYLECNWPPAFWSYLEASHLLGVDTAQGLEELKGQSIYFAPSEILSMVNLFQTAAAHRAPAIYLAMAGERPDGQIDGLPEFEDVYELFDEPPSIANGRTALFTGYEDQGFWDEVFGELPEDEQDGELAEKLGNMEIHEIGATPPKGTPAKIVELARRWRLHELRSLCREYLDSEYVTRTLAQCGEMFWPGSPGNTITEESELVWMISRNGASLNLYGEFEETNRSENTESCLQVWKFKVLMTRTAPDEEEDVVGYMAGWLVDPMIERTVCGEDDLAYLGQYNSPMLFDGMQGFLKSYLTFNGHEDVLDFVRNTDNGAVAISEIVLRDKYKKMGLASLALTGFSSIQHNIPHSDFPSGWKELADFDMDTNADILDRDAEVYINAPSVFMVPTQRQNKRLRSYLMSMTPPDELFREDGIDVFPFHFDDKRRVSKDALDPT